MAWTRQQLLDYWNTYITANNNQEITGAIQNVGGVEIINAMTFGEAV